MSSPIDALLHPVRWRIAQALGLGPMTVRDLREQVSDVPQATLYRHLQPLLDAGVVEVVAEVPTRGAVERTYALTDVRTRAGDLDADGHRRAFAFLQAVQAGEVDRYLSSPHADPEVDGLSYTHAVVHLDDAERARFAEELAALVERYLRPSSAAARPMGVGLLMVPGVGERRHGTS